MRIVVIAPKEPAALFDRFWEGVWAGTFDIAQFGAEVTEVTPPLHDVETQREVLSGLLQAEVDAIAIAPAHGSALDDLIAQHIERGIAVVTFHSDAPQSGRTLFVGPNAFQSGRLAGELLAKLMGGQGRVLTLPGPGRQSHFAQQYGGLQEELARHPGIHEVLALSASDGPIDLAGLLQAAGPIDGIYASALHIAEVGKALEECGLRIPCVGYRNDEAEPLVVRGVISAIIDESRFQQGYFALQKAFEAASENHRPAANPPGISMPCSVVLASNLNQAGAGHPLNEAFERLVFQRTASLISHQKMLQEANAKLEMLATTDPLTGLCNRRRFQEALEREVSVGRRYGTVSLLMIDLNWFKPLNDRYGHQAGDEALKTVARLLESGRRSPDICARLGGDEFAVILPQTGSDGASAVRNKLIELANQTRMPWEGEELRLSLSIGIATLSREISTPEHLLSVADADMYRYKAAMKANRSA